MALLQIHLRALVQSLYGYVHTADLPMVRASPHARINCDTSRVRDHKYVMMAI